MILIEVTRLRGSKFVINADLIETIEATPDTVITLVNGHRYVVEEPVDKVVDLIVSYHKRISSGDRITRMDEGA